jgi:carbamoyl-phosphate synthase large subunit
MDKEAPRMSEQSTPSPDPSPMIASHSPKKKRTRPAGVMLTGVGGIIGQGIMKCLEKSPYRVIGLDSSEFAAGLYAVPKGYLVPLARDPMYIDRLLEICETESVRYLFPGLDMELPIFARESARFKEAGVTLILSRREVIDLGDDKLATVRFLESKGMPAPRTFDFEDEHSKQVGFPLILKPRKGGSRSQGVYLVKDEEEMSFRQHMVDPTNCVVQEYIEGEEYSCGTVNLDGKCHGVMVMRRTLRDGDSHKAHVVRDPVIETHIRNVAEALKPFGSCNFQLRLRDGIPYIFEINPRCSGGSYIRALAGFNEPLMTLDYLEHGTPPAFDVRLVSIFRYWKEIIVDSQKIADTRRTGVVRNPGQNL